MVDIESEYKLIKEEKDIVTKVNKLNLLSYDVRYISPSRSFEIAEESRKLSQQTKNGELEAISKMNMGFAKFLMSDDFPILKYLIEAHDVLIETKKNPEFPILLNYLGNVYESYGEYQKALHFSQESLKLAGDNGLKETQADSHSIIGIIFSRLSDFTSAIKNFEQSLSLREEIDNKPAMASSLNLIARTYAQENQFGKSEEYYRKAIDLRLAINDTGALPWSYLGMASLFEKQKDYKKAVEYYETSLRMNEKSGDRRCRLHCSFGLARIYFEQNDMDKTEAYINETLELANELNAKPISFEVHRLFADYYEKAGNIPGAYDHFKKFQQIKEEVLSDQLHNKLKNQQISFEVEKSQKEAEIYYLRNVELKKAFDEIEKKNQEILDSITYAKNIQTAVMLPPTYLKNSMNDYFILFMPRDIVSGDFYWSLETENKIYIVAADCTGHGVPGAFMSMLGMTFINEVVQNNLNATPAQILDILRCRIINALRQSDDMTGAKDGMDISFCIIHKNKSLLEYSGAYNHLYYVYNNEFFEIRANRMPIGYHPLMEEPFVNHEIKTEKGMCFYMYSDGYSDQFGGEEGKKFMSRNLKNLLLQIHHKPMSDQKNILERTIKTWKEGCSQTDDILVIGFRI